MVAVREESVSSAGSVREEAASAVRPDYETFSQAGTDDEVTPSL